MNHKKYCDINAFQTKYVDAFNKGDQIVIQEKLDGANSSFEYDKDTDSLASFSRRNVLTASDTLRGFKTFVDLLKIDKYRSLLNLRLFGEWLVRHSIPYPDDKYGKFYMFDIFNSEKHIYLPYEQVKSMADSLELLTVPTFYVGEFISWEHIESFIGKTEMGGKGGEGIVVKNMTRLNDPNNRLPFYTKLVTTDFKEKMMAKVKEPLSLDEIARMEYERELVESIITRARVQKFLHNFVDEGIIPEDWGVEELNIVARHLGRRLYEDSIKEEAEIVEKVGTNFGKRAASIGMAIAREIATRN